MCEVRIENSVPRVTVWHHEAASWCKTVIPREGIFSPHRTLMLDFFFLLTFWFRIFYFKSSLVMQNSEPEGWNFLSASNIDVGFFFLLTFWFRIFYFKSSIHCRTQWRWRRTFLKLTSSWHRCEVNLTTKLRDVLSIRWSPMWKVP